MIPRAELADRFSYHPALTDEKRFAHERIRSNVLSLAERFNEILPDGREKSIVMTKLEEAMFWANAAEARKQ